MALTGQAMKSAVGRSEGTPCIGVAPWRKVTHREKLYEKRMADGAPLQIGRAHV